MTTTQQQNWTATWTNSCRCYFCPECEVGTVADYGDNCNYCNGELESTEWCDGMCSEVMNEDIEQIITEWHKSHDSKPFIIKGSGMTWRSVSGSTETLTSWKDALNVLTDDYELTLRFTYDPTARTLTATRSSHDEPMGARFEFVLPDLDWIREHRDGCSDTIALFEWSQNFNYPSPFSLFLDIIGWSDERIGVMLCAGEMPPMGYMECDYLGDALKEFAQDPSNVLEVIELLLETEN